MIDTYDGGVSDFIGFMASLSRQVNTSVVMEDAAKFAASELTGEFGHMADARSLVQKKQEITDQKLQELEAAIFEHVENFESAGA